jgi:hypothetical protein
MKKLYLPLVLAFSLSSCFKNYFQVQTLPTSTATAKALNDSGQTVYIHFKDQVRQLKQFSIADSLISGKLSVPVKMRKKYMEPTDPKMNKYKIRDRNFLFNQVHVYVRDSISASVDYTLNTSEADHIEIYQPNKGASRGSHILGASLILLTIVGIAVGTAYSIF